MRISAESAEKILRAQVTKAMDGEPVYALGRSEPIYYRKKVRPEGRKLSKNEDKGNKTEMTIFKSLRLRLVMRFARLLHVPIEPHQEYLSRSYR